MFEFLFFPPFPFVQTNLFTQINKFITNEKLKIKFVLWSRKKRNTKHNRVEEEPMPGYIHQIILEYFQ
jgi:hypothetical protein